MHRLFARQRPATFLIQAVNLNEQLQRRRDPFLPLLIDRRNQRCQLTQESTTQRDQRQLRCRGAHCHAGFATAWLAGARMTGQPILFIAYLTLQPFRHPPARQQRCIQRRVHFPQSGNVTCGQNVRLRKAAVPVIQHQNIFCRFPEEAAIGLCCCPLRRDQANPFQRILISFPHSKLL